MKRTRLVLTFFLPALVLAAAGWGATACKGGADGYGDAGPDSDVIGSLTGGKGSGNDDGAGSRDACAVSEDDASERGCDAGE